MVSPSLYHGTQTELERLELSVIAPSGSSPEVYERLS
jgi:hypothetical protein